MNIYKKKIKNKNSKLISNKHDSEPASGAWRPPDPPRHQLDLPHGGACPLHPPPNPAPASTQPQDTTSKRSPSWCQPFLGQLEVHSQQGTPTCWTKRSFQQTLGVWFVNTYKEK